MNTNEFTLVAGKVGSVVEQCRIKLLHEDDNVHVIFVVRQMVIKAGFKHTEEIMIATAASELATNILRYAHKGEIIVSIIKNLNSGYIGIELLASDRGPGIENIELAMQEQYSSLSNSLGLGLPSVKRIMDEFFMESIIGQGTQVLVRRWNRI